MSPQVVTETLYALAVAGDPPWVPDEIHLITTGLGAEQARLNLLSGQPGWFHRLRQDYNLPDIRFDEHHIHAIRDRHGRILEDIRNPADNEAAADFITERVRELTANPGSAVHASIAGGRKTMGFFLGYALSLYGRPQDRLSHVLVSAPFESLARFYYPTPYESIIHASQDGKPRTLDARDATITLADIPFVRLRDGQPKRLLAGQARFCDSVAAAQRALEPAHLIVDLSGEKLIAGGADILMAPAELAFYALLARRARNGEGHLRHTDPGLAGLYLAEYVRLVGGHSGPMQHAEQRLADDDLKAWFEERLSKCKRAILATLDEAAARPYLIQKSGARPCTRYGLALAAEAIEITGGKP